MTKKIDKAQYLAPLHRIVLELQINLQPVNVEPDLIDDFYTR